MDITILVVQSCGEDQLKLPFGLCVDQEMEPVTIALEDMKLGATSDRDRASSLPCFAYAPRLGLGLLDLDHMVEQSVFPDGCQVG